ncbi:hypothetical protein HJFPF1_07721 [Paramyrothecium foliicola]|nr:hypothetical protein HJFPF1_07721 [Paramyrothecium foliicola]
MPLMHHVDHDSQDQEQENSKSFDLLARLGNAQLMDTRTTRYSAHILGTYNSPKCQDQQIHGAFLQQISAETSQDIGGAFTNDVASQAD